MTTGVRIFGLSGAFFAVATGIYSMSAAGEPAGTILLSSMFVMSAALASILAVRYRSQRRAAICVARPQAAGDTSVQEVGVLPSDSAVPMIASVACSIVAVGLVVGVAMLLVGFVAFACSVMFLFRRSF